MMNKYSHTKQVGNPRGHVWARNGPGTAEADPTGQYWQQRAAWFLFMVVLVHQVGIQLQQMATIGLMPQLVHLNHHSCWCITLTRTEAPGIRRRPRPICKHAYICNCYFKLYVQLYGYCAPVFYYIMLYQILLLLKTFLVIFYLNILFFSFKAAHLNLFQFYWDYDSIFNEISIWVFCS